MKACASARGNGCGITLRASSFFSISGSDAIARNAALSLSRIGAGVFGFVQDRLGHRRSLMLCLAGWTLTIILLGASNNQTMFWVAANVAGLNLGAAQSAGRAMVGYLAPAARTGEFFGLWGLAVKAASVIGPLTYGLLSFVTGNNHRLAMLATGGFFIAGMFLLARVDVQAGHKRAGGKL